MFGSTPFLKCLVLGIVLICTSQSSFSQDLHKRKAKPNFMASASYGATYRDVMDPSQSYSRELYKYTNRTAAKTNWLVDLGVRYPVFKSMSIIAGAEYSSIIEKVSEGFSLTIPESMDKSEVFNSQLTTISGYLKIGETFKNKKKKYKTQLTFGPLFSFSSSYIGNTLDEEWKVIAIETEPETNLISAWDLTATIDFEVAKEIDLSVGFHGRKGTQMMHLDDGLYRNYNAAMGRVGLVYYPGRHNSTIHTIEREDKPEDEATPLEDDKG